MALVGIVIDHFPESFFAGLFHSKFDGLDAAEGVFSQLGVTFFEEYLEVSAYIRCFASQ